MPFKRSVRTTATTVNIKGTNWYLPAFHICLNTFGLARRKPIIIRIAARQAIGILFSRKGMLTTATSRNTPCAIADSFDFAPAATLADVLTITDVIGKPPTRPDNILPIPCAFNSVLALEYLFRGSILSPASRHSNVSILATTAIVAPIIQMSGFVNAEKLGVE